MAIHFSCFPRRLASLGILAFWQSVGTGGATKVPLQAQRKSANRCAVFAIVTLFVLESTRNQPVVSPWLLIAY